MLLSEEFDTVILPKLPTPILYAKVWGSHSHDTQLPTSDIDYLAVFQRPTAQLLNVTYNHDHDTIDGKSPDFQSHEIGKFCALLLKGNPGVVECLFTERMQYTTPVWDSLCEMRMDFINQQTLGQYLGYCDGQLHRLDVGTRLHSKGGEYNTKWAYHLIRIAYDALRIAQGEPPVVFKSAGERILLMSIRNGNYTPEQIAELYSELKSAIKATNSTIPLAADTQKLNDWLYEQRLKGLT